MKQSASVWKQSANSHESLVPHKQFPPRLNSGPEGPTKREALLLQFLVACGRLLNPGSRTTFHSVHFLLHFFA